MEGGPGRLAIGANPVPGPRIKVCEHTVLKSNNAEASIFANHIPTVPYYYNYTIMWGFGSSAGSKHIAETPVPLTSPSWEGERQEPCARAGAVRVKAHVGQYIQM